MKRSFTLGQVLTVIGGKMLCSGGELYEVYNFLTQDDLFTHQLPRAAKECEPVVKARHPELAALPFDEITPENGREWLAKQVERFGPTVELETIPPQSHAEIDPLREAEQIFGIDHVIVVSTE